MKFNTRHLSTLRKIPFFSLFKEDDLKTLMNQGTWLQVNSATMIINEGDVSQEFYILVQGKVRVFKHSKTLDVLRRGDIFGEIGALLHEPRSANVIALEDCYLFEYQEINLMRLPKPILYPVMKYIFSITAKRLKSINKKYVLL